MIYLYAFSECYATFDSFKAIAMIHLSLKFKCKECQQCTNKMHSYRSVELSLTLCCCRNYQGNHVLLVDLIVMVTEQSGFMY